MLAKLPPFPHSHKTNSIRERGKSENQNKENYDSQGGHSQIGHIVNRETKHVSRARLQLRDVSAFLDVHV